MFRLLKHAAPLTIAYQDPHEKHAEINIQAYDITMKPLLLCRTIFKQFK